MKNWLFLISLAAMLQAGTCKDGDTESTTQVPASSELPDSTGMEAPKHNAPNQAQIDSLKKAKTEAKKKKDDGNN